MAYNDRFSTPRRPINTGEAPSIAGQTFSLGTYLGVRVSIHVMFLFYIAFLLFTGGPDIAGNARWLAMLFMSVLLHEYGHALSCRAVGGAANDIILWPLGGLALVSPPHRPGAQFITTICGPLVNVAICAACYASLFLWLGKDGVPIRFDGIWVNIGHHDSSRARFAADLFQINYILFVFNMLLVFYPFDGGRLVQEILWKLIGYYRSMMVATVLGMLGAAALIAFAAYSYLQPHAAMRNNAFMLGLIGLLGFSTCRKQFTGLREARRSAIDRADADPGNRFSSR